jgi:hypothetical protein
MFQVSQKSDTRHAAVTMARRKGKADDPIMWEVDEDGNEIGAEPVEAAKKKGKDKSKDLLKSMNRSSADKPMTAKQRKELERKVGQSPL